MWFRERKRNQEQEQLKRQVYEIALNDGFSLLHETLSNGSIYIEDGYLYFCSRDETVERIVVPGKWVGVILSSSVNL